MKKNEIRVLIPHYIRLINVLIQGVINLAFTRVKAAWWGVRIGKKLKVNGTIFFRKLPKTDIKIDNSCCFNSKFNSNLIGINRPCMISTLQKGAKIEIGCNCGFSGTVIGAFNSIKLGDNVRCGANTLITDSDWHNDDPRVGAPQPVVLEDNVWLGEGVKVLKGVTIGENSVIGAGSVVVKSIPANVIAGGNPCKVLKILQL